MKKIVAALLVLALCLSVLPAAFAADTDAKVINWEDWEPLAQERNLNGAYVNIAGDENLQMWLWDNLHEVEISEEESNETSIIALYTDDSETNFACVSFFQFEETFGNADLGALLEGLDGVEDLTAFELNGVPSWLYQYKTDSNDVVYVVSISLGQGFVTEFAYTCGDASFEGVAEVMAASIRAVTIG